MRSADIKLPPRSSASLWMGGEWIDSGAAAVMDGKLVFRKGLAMLQFPDHMRPMKPGEETAVDDLLRVAFPGVDEAELVQNLRRSGAMAGETVLPMGKRIVGYYALSKMVAPQDWLCLAPVAVAPDVQGRRFCTRMMGMLSEWARMSERTVVVLGRVSLYERGGFSQARAQNLTSPYPLEHTMLAGPGAEAPKQTLRYPKAFASD